MKKKNNIVIKIEKVSNYNPKNFFNMLFNKKDKIVKENTYNILKENAELEEYYPDEQQVKQELLELLSTLPALELEIEDDNLKLTNKEMLKLIKKINNSIYFFFLYFYKKGYLKKFDINKDYFEEE